MQVSCSQEHANNSSHRLCTRPSEALLLTLEQVIYNRYETWHISCIRVRWVWA